MAKHKTEVLDKKADLAGPGIGKLRGAGEGPPDRLHAASRPEEDAACDHGRQAVHRGRPLPRAEPHAGRGPSHRRRRERRERLPRPRRLARARSTFHIANDNDKHPIEAQVVQAATKWKRIALKQFGMKPGEGLVTDMRAVRKDYFLDHDHSAYVDQWDWEKVITPGERNLDFLTKTVEGIWKVIEGAEDFALDSCPGPEEEEAPAPAREARLPARRGDPRQVPRPAAQGARDRDPQGAPGGLHLRHRLDAEGRLSARDARGGLRRLGHADAHEGRPRRCTA